MTDKRNEHPISPDTEQFISEHPEAKVLHVPRIGEQPKADAPTAAPLPAEEWLHSELANPNSDVACRWLEREAKENGVLDYLAVLLESYSSHVNSGLLKELEQERANVDQLCGDANAIAQDYTNAAESLRTAEARISVLERERDELCKSATTMQTELGKLKSAESTLREALRKLVDKLNAVGPAIRPFFLCAFTHGMEYHGPSWDEEVESAERALTPPTTL